MDIYINFTTVFNDNINDNSILYRQKHSEKDIVMKKIITLLILSIWIGGFCLFAYKINHFDIDKNQKTDAIIVLTGGRNRITEAIKLFNNSQSEYLFISGVAKDINLNNIQNTHKIKINNTQNAIIGHNAENTVENAKETYNWIKENNIKSIRLVTSNYHIYRSLIEFKKHVKDTQILPHPVFSQYIEKKWWKSWQTFSLIFKEYNKFICAYIINKIKR